MAGEENTCADAAPTPQCQFFVQRKKRLCRMTVKPGRHYCGEHEPQPKTETGQSDKRIPCPNDPKHTIYASKLLKHLAICNARQTEQPPYIQHNINAPGAGENCPRRPLSAIPKDEIAAVVDKVNRLYAKHVEGHIAEEPSQGIHRAVVEEFSAASRAESSRRHLRQVSALLAAAERAGLVRDRSCYVELGAGKGQLSYYACHAWCAGAASRVLAVDRAPLRHKRDNKLRSDPPRPHPPPPRGPTGDHYNHGYTSQPSGGSADDTQTTDHVNTVNKDSNIMDIAGDSDIHKLSTTANGASNGEVSKYSIDGLSNANKISESPDATAENLNSERELDDCSKEKAVDVKDNNENSEGEVAVRLRADLAHLALEAVPVVAGSAAVVGIAKHLCGAATDLALRCVSAAGVAHKTRGAVLAACCHHRLERALYVANPQLQELGIDSEDFNVMLGIVSWATCGDGRSRERRLARPEPEPTPEPRPGHALSREQQESVGRRAKALLDWGRVLWLRERGFDARLAYYVPKEVSLENTVIIASKR